MIAGDIVGCDSKYIEEALIVGNNYFPIVDDKYAVRRCLVDRGNQRVFKLAVDPAFQRSFHRLLSGKARNSVFSYGDGLMNQSAVPMPDPRPQRGCARPSRK